MRHKELLEKLAKLERLVIIDALTELYNYRYFQEAFTKEVYRAKRYARNVSLMIIDIDNFKQINDTLGHTFGNTIIKQIANILVASTRKANIVCRYGGDEFIVILPETDEKQVIRLANRLRKAILNQTEVTVSIGAGTLPKDAKTTKGLFNKTDRALYRAKEKKNKVSV